MMTKEEYIQSVSKIFCIYGTIAKDVLNAANLYIEKALKIAKSGDCTDDIGAVYYAGGTLCIDVNDVNNKKFCVLMVNVFDESVSIEPIYDSETLLFKRRLLDIPSLKKSFEIYEIVKGKTKYWEECFNKSCIRHLAN